MVNNVGTCKKIFWVNLVSNGKYFESIKIDNYEACVIDGYIFGSKSPTNICLPKNQPSIEFVHKFMNYIEPPVGKQNYHKKDLLEATKFSIHNII